MKRSTLGIRSLSALILAASLTACAGKQAARPAPTKPPAELVAPLPAEPALGVGNSSATVARYIADLRNFACDARARFNGLVAFALGEERPDPNAGRCAAAAPPAPPPAQPPR